MPEGLRRAALAAALCVFGRAAVALDPGAASGRLRLGEIERTLSSSAALDYADRAGLARYVGDGPALRIALAAAAIPPDALDGPGHQALRTALQAEAFPVILLRLPREAHGALASARLLLLDAGPAPLATFEEVSITIARGERRVLGTLDWTSSDRRVRLLASFSAPLFEERAPRVDVTGEAARDSAEARSLLVFEQALRQGAFARAREHATARRRQSLADLEGRDEGEIAALAAALPAPARRRAGITRLVEATPRAWLLGDDPAAPIVYLKEIAGRWRVDAP